MRLTAEPQEQTSLRSLGRLIHRKKSRLWQLNKALAGVPKYCFAYHSMDIPFEYVKQKQKTENLKSPKQKEGSH